MRIEKENQNVYRIIQNKVPWDFVKFVDIGPPEPHLLFWWLYPYILRHLRSLLLGKSPKISRPMSLILSNFASWGCWGHFCKKMKQLKICKSLWIITILSGTWPWLRPIKLCMKMLESCHNRIQICQFGFVRVRAHPKIKQNVSIDAQSWGCPWWCDDTLSIIPTTEIKSF